MTYFTLLTDCQNTFYWKCMQHTMGCGQGHPGTKYDYGAMSAVCWLVLQFLQLTSTTDMWAIHNLVVMKYTHRHWFIQNKTIKQELRLDPSGTTYKSSVSARYLSCTTSAKQSSMDSNWALALWQPSRSSWHRIWGQTLMTRPYRPTIHTL